ncbi:MULTISPECIES: OmpP1/FadL family transporter [unclassified Carboxylicivirga]|uniref:OmpP1/FadL family transporter n=1 Tax=Carboxylicivirga TaxID=1628153 RepID=UPI003D330F6B
MKKISLIIFVCITSIGLLQSQTIDDALRFNKRELTGTSRSLGMANAFGALGGDLSALSINPAGIAVYRNSDFAFTPSVSLNQTKSSFLGMNSKDDKYAFPFNQIGGVTTIRSLRDKDKGLISTHFGFTYNRTADFNQNISMLLGQKITDNHEMGQINTLLTNIMLDANGYAPYELEDIENGASQFDPLHSSYWAYETYLTSLVDGEEDIYLSQYHYTDSDRPGEIPYRNFNGIDQYNIIERDGYGGEYAFTFGANISHVLLLGASLNFQTYRFEEKESFREVNAYGFDPAYNEDLDYYDLYTNLSQKGFGVNGKFGLILNLHPIRLGAAFHTPTFYDIDEKFDYGMESFFKDRFTQRWLSSYRFDYSYNYRTPYRASGSLAMVLGKIALLSLDYEMTDHTASKFSPKNGFATYFDQLNRMVDEQMKVTHDFRAGVELKPIPFFAIRAGAAYFDSPLKKEYTDKELTKWMATAGLGIRNKNFYFDVAYALMISDQNYNINANENSLSHPHLDPLYFTGIELNNRQHQASFTFGWKF